MNIKITKQEKEIEGTIKEGVVKPFGTSAHIPFKREHLGKIVPVIVPTKPEYVWLLKDFERRKLINTARKIIIGEGGKLEHYRLKLLEDLSKDRFNLDSLIKIIALLEKEEKERDIIEKVKRLYKEK